MEGEIVLQNSVDASVAEGESRPLGHLEESVRRLLTRYHEILKENEELARSLRLESERNDRLEEKLEILSGDREKVKTRIDQLLLQLKVLDI
jgi:hypothetical protein